MFTATFTDPQGTTHVDAHFEVSICSLNYSSSKHFNNRISIGEVDESENSYLSMNYQMYYWTSAQAKQEGKLPYLLANREPMGDSFDVLDMDSAEYLNKSPEEAAEYHCLTYILNN